MGDLGRKKELFGEGELKQILQKEAELNSQFDSLVDSTRAKYWPIEKLK